jgi:hypothetical protein
MSKESKRDGFPFTFRFVLNVDMPNYVVYRNANPNEIQTDCPFCNHKGKLYANIVKGTYYCQHCKKSGGMVTFHKDFNNLANNSVAYKDLTKAYNDTPEQEREAIRLEAEHQQIQGDIPNNVANITERDRCYRNMINALDLGQEDKKDLIKRGLSEEEIRNLGIVSTPVCLHTVAEKMLEIPDWQDYLPARIKKIQSEGSDIPGLYPTNDGVMFVKLKAGILIPVLNRQGLISMCQVRYRNLEPLKANASQKEKEKYEEAKKAYHKYAQLTSGYKEKGCSTSGLEKVHHIGFDFKNLSSGNTPEEVCVTEGCLKADVASYLENNMAYIAVLGVNSTNQLADEFKWLYENGTKRIRIRFDMDFVSNDAVRQAIYDVNALAQKQGAISCVCKKKDPSPKWLSEFEIYKSLMNGEISDSKKLAPLTYTVVNSREELLKIDRKVVLTDIWNIENGKGIDDYLQNRRKHS